MPLACHDEGEPPTTLIGSSLSKTSEARLLPVSKLGASDVYTRQGRIEVTGSPCTRRQLLEVRHQSQVEY